MKSLKILGHTVKVTEEKNLARDRNAAGESSGNCLEITLDPSFPDSAKDSTLLHEIIEQINYHLNINLEHHQICLLETGLCSVLSANKLKF